MMMQQAKENIKIAGPCYVFFFQPRMADAGVGVFVWRMNNCGILALVFFFFFFFFFSSQFYSPLGRSPMSDVTTT